MPDVNQDALPPDSQARRFRATSDHTPNLSNGRQVSSEQPAHSSTPSVAEQGGYSSAPAFGSGATRGRAPASIHVARLPGKVRHVVPGKVKASGRAGEDTPPIEPLLKIPYYPARAGASASNADRALCHSLRTPAYPRPTPDLPGCPKVYCLLCVPDRRLANGLPNPPADALAKKLGASLYIDSKVTSAAEALQQIGGARVILATAPSSKAMSALVGGLGPTEGSWSFVQHSTRSRSRRSNSSQEAARRRGGPRGRRLIPDALPFAELTGVRPMIETYPLERAAEAYARMLSGKTESRVVLTM